MLPFSLALVSLAFKKYMKLISVLKHHTAQTFLEEKNVKRTCFCHLQKGFNHYMFSLIYEFIIVKANATFKVE